MVTGPGFRVYGLGLRFQALERFGERTSGAQEQQVTEKTGLLSWSMDKLSLTPRP